MVKKGTTMGFKDILGELYTRYYDGAEASAVSSSHWKFCHSKTTVVKLNDSYVLSGYGFGHFVPRHSLRALKHYLPSKLALGLLDQYHVDPAIRSFGLEAAKKQQRQVDFDCVKQILSVDLLSKNKIFNKVKTVMIVGDGYGYMTALMRMMLPEATIFCVNLGRTLFFDAYYLQKVFPKENCSLLNDNQLITIQDKKPQMIFWEAENYLALLSLPVDLFINIASMGEMNMSVVHNYFKIMRSSSGQKYFYCCNRVEKILPDGETVRFDEYPWGAQDEIILDELCPWYQRYPVPQPPFWKPFQGPLKHRLALLGNDLVKNGIITSKIMLQ